ncbi:MAG: HIT domain-containing protein [Armatimonadota bacterium]|nr:HIT domain-containing protein [Armatimonadota bacterium]MDR5697471.1 HIT domain-containing protein [Armatimonadota bacterium]
MRQLWAPWRLAYIKSPPAAECIFCAARDSDADAESLVVWRGERVFVMLNRYPYSSGHLMAVPHRHTANLNALTDPETLGLWDAVCRSVAALRAGLGAEAFNIGLNLGRAAGAGIEDHLHVHVVPRWAGDTNFMPVLADVKVIPQHIEDTYRVLRDAFASLEASPAGRGQRENLAPR